jgi:hypothetical protein
MSRLGPAIGWVSVALQPTVSCCYELPLDPVALVDCATIDNALPFRASPTSTSYKIGFTRTFVVTVSIVHWQFLNSLHLLATCTSFDLLVMGTLISMRSLGQHLHILVPTLTMDRREIGFVESGRSGPLTLQILEAE